MAEITQIPGIGYGGGAEAPKVTSQKVGYLASSQRTVKTELGKNDFLSLLAAQMQYQNPLEPVADTAFVAQLAQFSSLEQLSTIGTAMTNMANSQAYSMVGKYVIAEATVDGVPGTIDGTVDCVFTKNGVTYATIGVYEVPINSITTVFDKELFSVDKTLIESSNLIGREVTALTVGEGEKIVPIDGIVKRVSLENGELYAYLDNETESGIKVLIKDLIDIRDVGTSTGTDTNKELAEALKMIDREVTAEIEDEDGNIITVTGLVKYIAEEDGEIFAYLENGAEPDIKVNVKDITDIRDTEATEATEEESESTVNEAVYEALKLIGREIVAEISDSDGNIEQVTGIVTEIYVEDGEVYASVETATESGKKVPVTAVKEDREPEIEA